MNNPVTAQDEHEKEVAELEYKVVQLIANEYCGLSEAEISAALNLFDFSEAMEKIINEHYRTMGD